MTAAALAPQSDAEPLLARFAPLVNRIARQMVAKLPASVELDDIVQAGMIGLMDAARRYRDDRGAQFETFATQRVRGAMLDELRQNDWAPRSVRRSQRTLEAAVRGLEQRLGRRPTEREIARELGVDLATYRELQAEARGGQIVSLEELDDTRDGESITRQRADPACEPQAIAEERRIRGDLVAAIAALPERERQLMRLYYEEDLNFREIAAVFAVTESRVCQMHGRAVARLRAKVGN